MMSERDMGNVRRDLRHMTLHAIVINLLKSLFGRKTTRGALMAFKALALIKLRIALFRLLLMHVVASDTAQ